MGGAVRNTDAPPSSLPLNVRVFDRLPKLPVKVRFTNPQKTRYQTSNPEANSAVQLEEDGMFRSVKRIPAKKAEEALPGLMNGARGALVAEIMNGIAETLAKSCLYF